VVDIARGKVAARIPVGRTPWNIALAPDGGKAFVSNAGDDTVAVIDTARRAVTATVGVGHIPTGIHATQSQVWVSGNASSTVTVLDAASHAVLGAVDLGLGTEPAGIAVAG
jgi:phospholipase C